MCWCPPFVCMWRNDKLEFLWIRLDLLFSCHSILFFPNMDTKIKHRLLCKSWHKKWHFAVKTPLISVIGYQSTPLAIIIIQNRDIMQGHSKKTTDKRAFFWMSITLESSLQRKHELKPVIQTTNNNDVFSFFRRKERFHGFMWYKILFCQFLMTYWFLSWELSEAAALKMARIKRRQLKNKKATTSQISNPMVSWFYSIRDKPNWLTSSMSIAYIIYNIYSIKKS